MNLGGIAAIIAAAAFAVLVVFICLSLKNLSQILTDFQETVKRLNTTIDVVTKDVDNLSIEVEGLLNKANVLVDDVNQKISKTDPLFTAIGDIGETTSELTDAVGGLASTFINESKFKKSPVQRILKTTQSVSRAQRTNTPRTANAVHTTPEQAAESSAVHTEAERIAAEHEAATRTLKQFINAEPSKTAGEIRIK